MWDFLLLFVMLFVEKTSLYIFQSIAVLEVELRPTKNLLKMAKKNIVNFTLNMV